VLSRVIAGPDGRPWWIGDTEDRAGGKTFSYSALYELTSTDTEALVYRLPWETWIDTPRDLTLGPDGAIWLPLSHHLPPPALGRYISGSSLGEIAINAEWPEHLASGPGAWIWFTQLFPPAIGRVNATGAIMQWPIGGEAQTLINGPEETDWFAISYPHAIGKITAAGVISEYPLSSNSSSRVVLAPGPEGNIWFAKTDELSAGADSLASVGRITPQGAITEYPLPARGAEGGLSPTSIALGPEGDLWIAATSPNTLIRVNPAALTASVASVRARTLTCRPRRRRSRTRARRTQC
jgi:virginiamycin B lyase